MGLRWISLLSESTSSGCSSPSVNPASVKNGQPNRPSSEGRVWIRRIPDFSVRTYRYYCGNRNELCWGFKNPAVAYYLQYPKQSSFYISVYRWCKIAFDSFLLAFAAKLLKVIATRRNAEYSCYPANDAVGMAPTRLGKGINFCTKPGFTSGQHYDEECKGPVTGNKKMPITTS